jgi:sugar/nucleoside kinase (ribokinase family)
MASKNFLGVVGHTNLDFIFNVPRFPDPQKHASVEVQGEKLLFGGTAGNLCMVAGALGVKVGIASFVGGDFPITYMQAFKDAKVDLTDFKVIDDRRTPCCWVLTAMNGDQVSIINQGAMNHMEGYELPSYTINNSKIIHLMTGSRKILSRIATIAKNKGVKIGFDPCQNTYWYTKEELLEMLKYSNHGFFNEVEAEAVLKKIGKQKEEDLLEFFKWLVITRHEKGSTIYQKDSDPIQIGIAKPKKLIDPTGAGDAYRAGFYLGLSKGFELEKCGELAATVASFMVEKVGCQTNIPNMDKVKQRFNEDFGEKLDL